MELRAGTYTFSESISYSDIAAGEYPINFDSGIYSFGSMILLYNYQDDLIYQSNPGEPPAAAVYDINGWVDDEYRTITIPYDQTVSDDFGEWIEANSTYDDGTITLTIRFDGQTIATKDGIVPAVTSINWFSESDSLIQMDLHGDSESSITIPTEYGDHPDWLVFADQDGNIFDDPAGSTVNWTDDVILDMIVVGAPPVLTIRDRLGQVLASFTGSRTIDRMVLVDLGEGQANVTVFGTQTQTINYGETNALQGLAYSLTATEPDIYPGLTILDITEDTELYIVTTALPGLDKITFYRSFSDNNRLNKVPYLSNPMEITGTFRESVSITDPVVLVEGNITGQNYAYIPNFGRYYFITDIVCINASLFEVHLHVDVLMSFRSEILAANCYVDRNEYDFDPLLTDHRRPIKTIDNLTFLAPTERVTEFNPNMFDYVITVSGGNE